MGSKQQSDQKLASLLGGGLMPTHVQGHQEHYLAVPSVAHAMNSLVNIYSLCHLSAFLLRKAKITTLVSLAGLHLIPSKGVGSPV